MKKIKTTILAVLVITLLLSSFVYASESQNLSRIQFIKEVLKVMNVEVDKGAISPFTDVLDKEDIPYIAAAYNKKIVTGSGGKFNPKGNITNEQAVVIIVRALGVLNINQDDASKTEIKFLDANEISDWAKPYVAYALRYGLIENSQIKFNPQGQVTKVQCDRMLDRFKEAFVKDGLTAIQLLQLANKQLKQYDTYKLEGNIDIIRSVKLPTGKQENSTTNMSYQSPQLSSNNLETTGIYARYGEDVNINGEEYYVIKVDLDTEDFMEIYNEIIKESFNTMFEGEAWDKIKKDQGIPEIMDEDVFKATVKTAIDQTLQNMDVEIVGEYYIHKENKSYGKFTITQVATMSFMGIETKVEMNGEYKYYVSGVEMQV